MNDYPGTPRIVAAAVVVGLTVVCWLVVVVLGWAIWFDHGRWPAVAVLGTAAGFAAGVWVTRWRQDRELEEARALIDRWSLGDSRYQLDEFPLPAERCPDEIEVGD